MGGGEPSRQVNRSGFTIVELLVSTAILMLLLVILFQLTDRTTATWQYTKSKTEQFREARNAFDTITRRISQATLNTYWDYDDLSNPTAYVRASELRFICGPVQSGTKPLDRGSYPPRPTHGIFFQAPFGLIAPTGSGPNWEQFRGLGEALNTWGYYVEVNDDADLRPKFLADKHEIAPLRIRSRLMELMQPAGAMSLYRYTSGKPGELPPVKQNPDNLELSRQWVRDLTNQASRPASEAGNFRELLAHPLAENIIALIIQPKLPERDLEDLPLTKEEKEIALAPDYFYHSGEIGAAEGKGGTIAAALNSKHQLPPIVQITMVAIDETSALKLDLRDITDDPLEIQDSKRFTSADNFKEDLLYDPVSSRGLDSLEKRLIDKGMNYRIFTNNITIRGAKWSQEQTK